MKKYNVAVVGATGMVGQEMLKTLAQRDFPINKIRLLASKRSRGKVIDFKGKKFSVEELKKDSFKGMDFALFSIGAELSKEFSPLAAKQGAIVIDNSNAFRMDKDVPLIVPEVNLHALKGHKGIIANPNCSTIQMVVVLAPLHKEAKIKRIVVSTYQSVSGWGKEAVEELSRQTRQILQGKKPFVRRDILPHQIAFNLIPQIDKFLDNGYTKEERKMVEETRKIMEEPKLAITATCVRVPVFTSHSEAVNIETEKKITAADARKILRPAAGIEVIDDPSQNLYPLPFQSANKDAVYVGRIREDESISNGLNLWIVSDNLRKGAALNAVQITEHLIE